MLKPLPSQNGKLEDLRMRPPSPEAILYQAYINGENEDVWDGAVHGLSLPALEYARRHGVIPGTPMNGTSYLYLYPFKEKIKGHPLANEIKFLARDDAMLLAEAAALGNAKEQTFLYSLGLDPIDRENLDLASDILSDPDETKRETRQYFRSLGLMGIKKERIIKARINAEGCSGALIVVSRSVFNPKQFDVTPGDPGEPDVKVDVGEGLLLCYLTRIIAKGDETQQFFKKLSHALSGSQSSHKK